MSIQVLRSFLTESQIPFPSLQYITGEVNYGGRVTDVWDRRLLNTILRRFYTPKILEPVHSLTASEVYRIPEEFGTDHERTYSDYIHTLPLSDEVEVFGLHPNANVTFQSKEASESFDILQAIHNSHIETELSGGAHSQIQMILASLPDPLKSNDIDTQPDPLVSHLPYQ